MNVTYIKIKSKLAVCQFLSASKIFAYDDNCKPKRHHTNHESHVLTIVPLCRENKLNGNNTV